MVNNLTNKIYWNINFLKTLKLIILLAIVNHIKYTKINNSFLFFIKIIIDLVIFF